MTTECLAYNFGQHTLVVDLWLKPFRWHLMIETKDSLMPACWPDVDAIAIAPMQDDDWQSLADWLKQNGIDPESAWAVLSELYNNYTAMNETLMRGEQLGLEMPDDNIDFTEWYTQVAGLDYPTARVLSFAGITPQKLIQMSETKVAMVRLMGKTRLKLVLDVRFRLLLGQK